MGNISIEFAAKTRPLNARPGSRRLRDHIGSGVLETLEIADIAEILAGAAGFLRKWDVLETYH